VERSTDKEKAREQSPAPEPSLSNKSVSATNAAPPADSRASQSVNAPKPQSPARLDRDKGSLDSGVQGGVVGGVVGGKIGAPGAVVPQQEVKKRKAEAERADPSNREGYTNYGVNPMISVNEDRLSTFAIDVDTASYTIARRKLNEGALPPAAAVRVEEFVNYFKYRYPQPASGQPISINIDGAPSPFRQGRHLLRVGLQGLEVPAQQRPNAHLTFLVDVSGSMNSDDKIGMLKRSLGILVENLKSGDTVAITTYAGSVRVVLPPTAAENKEQILSALNQLQSGGSTAMASGIQLAYQQAYASLQPNAINRIIICSDGDANVGNTSPTQILKDIEAYSRQGITVSVIGFGMGNYQDSIMEQFADKGNGNYYYIDSMAQAKRVFGSQLTGTLQVIAKDVKVQLEFNPHAVTRYRLIGYENRDVADEDFRKDHIDGGEVGAGHTVTALYELELAQPNPQDALVKVNVRYKQPREDQAREIARTFTYQMMYNNFQHSSQDFKFASSVAAFAEILRGSQEASRWSLDAVANIAKEVANSNERQEMVTLVSRAQALKNSR
jgi:Ca-activated chloride channel homolog